MASNSSSEDGGLVPGRAAASTLAALAVFAVGTVAAALVLSTVGGGDPGALIEMPVAPVPRLLMNLGEFVLGVAPVAAMAQIGVAALRRDRRLGILALSGVGVTVLGMLIAR